MGSVWREGIPAPAAPDMAGPLLEHLPRPERLPQEGQAAAGSVRFAQAVLARDLHKPRAAPATRTAPAAQGLPAGEQPPWQGGTQLTFLHQQAWEERQAPRQSGRALVAGDSDYIKSLPTWAQELLRRPDTRETSGPAGGGFQPPRSPGGHLPPNAVPGPNGQIRWTAPGVQPPGAVPAGSGDSVHRPAQIQWKSPGQDLQPSPPQPLGEAEIRKTADRVYHLIEERLRRELRRSGR